MTEFRFKHELVGAHVVVRLFSGVEPSVLSGTLRFTPEEWKDFRAAMIHGVGADYGNDWISIDWKDDQ